MLQVNEVGPRPGGEPRGADVAAGKFTDLVVGQDLLVAGDLGFGVEQRMPIRDPGLKPVFLVWSTEASRVGQLKPNRQVIGRIVPLGMRPEEGVEEAHDPG